MAQRKYTSKGLAWRLNKSACNSARMIYLRPAFVFWADHAIWDLSSSSSCFGLGSVIGVSSFALYHRLHSFSRYLTLVMFRAQQCWYAFMVVRTIDTFSDRCDFILKKRRQFSHWCTPQPPSSARRSCISETNTYSGIIQSSRSGCVRREILGVTQVDEKGHEVNTAVFIAYICRKKHGIYFS